MKLRFVTGKHVIEAAKPWLRTNDANHLQKRRRREKSGGFNS